MSSAEKEIAKKSKSSFYYAFNLLGQERSEAMNVIYAFCRQTDDIVDEPGIPDEKKASDLQQWKEDFEKALSSNSSNPLLTHVVEKIDEFSIPVEPFFDLIRGMKMDLEKNRYKTFSETEEYCYCAASTVGLMSIEIFGYKNDSAKEFAVNLGKALQLTNIIRDVRADYENDRIYLPEEDFIKYGYSEEDLKNNVYNDRFINLMKFQTKRAKEFYDRADRLLDIEDKQSMFAAMAMRHIYRRLLSKLEKEKFNIFENKINVSKKDKLILALGTWLKYKLIY